MRRFITAVLIVCSLALAPLRAEAIVHFGGAVGTVYGCVNTVIYATLGPPRGGAYVWSPQVTRTYSFGPPTHSGQWVLGNAGPSYFCIYSIFPIIVFPGLLMLMEGSSGNAVVPATVPKTVQPPSVSKQITDLASFLLDLVQSISAKSSSRGTVDSGDVDIHFLENAIVLETSYKEVRERSEARLQEGVQALRDKEDACWSTMVEQARDDLEDIVKKSACGAHYNCGIASTSTVAYSQATSTNVYDIVITAKAGTEEREMILAFNREHSEEALEEYVEDLLEVVTEAIELTTETLDRLRGFKEVIQNANTPENWRIVRERVIQMDAAGVLHNQSDVTDANTQHRQIRTAMEQVESEVIEEWDEEWCQPANWRDHLKEQ